MDYELKIPARHGHTIPLFYVAHSKAMSVATAGGTEFHMPAYKGAMDGFILDLLNAARSGQLKVCNQYGTPGTVDEIIKEAEQDGGLSIVSRYIVEPDWDKLHQEIPPIVEGLNVWNFSDTDLGPKEIDWDKTHINYLYASLKSLNEWAATRGDAFSLSNNSIEWIDERGIVGGKHNPEQGAPSSPAMLNSGKSAGQYAWVSAVREMAIPIYEEAVKQGYGSDQKSVAKRLEEACSVKNIKTDNGKPLTAEYIRRHALTPWDIPQIAQAKRQK